MPDVKTNALMPKGDKNGLAAIAGPLADEAARRAPRRLRAAIVIFDARRLNTDADTGEELVTVRFRRVEVLLPEDLAEAEKLIRRASEGRLGETVLPLDLEREIEHTFKDFDPDAPGDEPDPDAPVGLFPVDGVELADDDEPGDEPEDPDEPEGGAR